ncbi:uncharacterized protein ATNIH1004_007953 [Aspergillus tanneri]|uniref:Uncharacterized protein n=1 Tax=Aspergillus tanneri TaxID=1220188 RepID=A0A5M9MMK4_9EURO|nr:uncharacterized protein ATNIH1004_007953 [Aspergillus tanneri]KAA8646520.1 hypothetical protein ATNIH1004_007953 [Aspergillus tanneri]
MLLVCYMPTLNNPCIFQLSIALVPAKHADFVQYVNSHPQEPVSGLVRQYRDYDAIVRKMFAQEPDHPSISVGFLSIVPLSTEHESVDLKVRACDPSPESEEVKSKHLVPLKDEDRRPNGSPAVVSSMKEFRANFDIVCENSLHDLDWNNVVVPCSAVASSLVPVPEQYAHQAMASVASVTRSLRSRMT